MPSPKAAQQSLKHKVRPIILAIGTQDKTFADSRMYARLRVLLRKFADIYYCSSVGGCLSQLKKNDPYAILIVDAGITQRRDLTFACAEYMRRGGRIVFAANFANYMPPEQDMRRFFSAFGVFWSLEAISKREVSIEKAYGVVEDDNSVVWSCCQDQITYRAVRLLTNVKKEHAVYLVQKEDTEPAYEALPATVEDPDGNDMRVSPTDHEQSREQPKRIGPTRFETPVVWAKQKHGYIGVIGDVNAQPDSEALIVTMLGLIREV